MNGIRVSSDAPGVFFAVAAVAALMTLAIDGRPIVRQSCVVGLLSALAILMKSTNLALLPALGVSWIIAAVRSRARPTTAFASAASIGLILAIVLGPDLVHNLSTYGLATPMQEAVENRAKGRGFSDLYEAYRAFHPVAWGRWLFGEGLFIQGNWSFVLPIETITRLHWSVTEWATLGLAFPAAAFGLRRLIARVRRQAPEGLDGLAPGFDSLSTPLVCLAVCAGYYAALLYHALQSEMAWGRTTTGPWYASPAIPWFLMLVGVGASGWPRLVAPGFAAAIILLSLAAEQTSWWIQMLPVYSGGAFGWEALGRISSMQVWYLSTATCLASLAASLGLFGTVVWAISFASVEAEAVARSRAWITVDRRRDRVGASTTGLAVPSGRKLARRAPAAHDDESGDPPPWR